MLGCLPELGWLVGMWLLVGRQQQRIVRETCSLPALLDAATKVQIAPALLPELLQIVRDDDYGAGLQRKALAIVNTIVGVLHTVAGSVPAQAKGVVAGMAADWFPAFTHILTLRPSPGAWGVQQECLRVMTSLVGSFSKLCAQHVRPCMAATWALFAGSLHLYQRLVVEGEEGEQVERSPVEDGAAGPEGEGEGVDLEGVVAQLLEFVLTLVGNPRYQPLVKGSCADLIYVTLGEGAWGRSCADPCAAAAWCWQWDATITPCFLSCLPAWATPARHHSCAFSPPELAPASCLFLPSQLTPAGTTPWSPSDPPSVRPHMLQVTCR